MANVAVIGSQWGDEGKGKIVDWLSEKADVIVRFQGGHNAGHTLVVNGEVYKLSLLPSGVVREGKLSIIANGVVIDPFALIEEIGRLAKQGVVITPESLRVAENATLILPVHQQLDAAREKAANAPIGTTKRGIGPAYEDKMGRRAIRVMDLAHKDTLLEKIKHLLVHHNALLKHFNAPLCDAETLYKELCEIAPKILPFMDVTWRLLHEARGAEKKILFEGAQGTMLDVDHGTYPFVTSSNTIAGAASIGSGIGPQGVEFVLGITKAYTTRVGEGPFPTEQENEVGQRLGERGHEFGTVTGRKRRCGWFDAVMVRQAVQIGGISGIALTKLDVLGGFEELKICTGYRLGDKRIDYLPAASCEQGAVQPIYETLAGWSEDISGVRKWEDLPKNAIRYMRFIEEKIACPISLISTSPKREDTILLQDPFASGS